MLYRSLQSLAYKLMAGIAQKSCIGVDDGGIRLRKVDQATLDRRSTHGTEQNFRHRKYNSKTAGKREWRLQ